MRALRLTSWKADPALVEVPEPVAGPGEVVVRIAGACHSDLHLMRDLDESLTPWHLPFTLGHENAGWVHELGAGVSGLSPGQPVAVCGAWGCDQCDRCRTGLENYCSQPELESLLALAAQGKVQPRVTTFPLDEAVDVYHQLEGGRIDGRAVIVPSG